MFAPLITLFVLNAQASGCGFYGNSLTILQRELAGYARYEEYAIKERGEGYIVITDKNASTDHKLYWEKTEHAKIEYGNQDLSKQDIYFEEGNGCGPIFLCITGQWRLELDDPKTQTRSVYSYPRIVDYFMGDSPRTLSAKDLIPVFGTMKLPQASLKDDSYADNETAVNRELCSHGDW